MYVIFFGGDCLNATHLWLRMMTGYILINFTFACCVGEFIRLAELPCLIDLVFVKNPLEEKHSAEGTWMEEACKRLPNLRKLDGKLDYSKAALKGH